MAAILAAQQQRWGDQQRPMGTSLIEECCRGRNIACVFPVDGRLSRTPFVAPPIFCYTHDSDDSKTIVPAGRPASRRARLLKTLPPEQLVAIKPLSTSGSPKAPWRYLPQ